MILKTNFKEIYFRLILVTASVLIALFIFEIILRLFGFEPFEIKKYKNKNVIFKYIGRASCRERFYIYV